MAGVHDGLHHRDGLNDGPRQKFGDLRDHSVVAAEDVVAHDDLAHHALPLAIVVEFAVGVEVRRACAGAPPVGVFRRSSRMPDASVAGEAHTVGPGAPGFAHRVAEHDGPACRAAGDATRRRSGGCRASIPDGDNRPAEYPTRANGPGNRLIWRMSSSRPSEIDGHMGNGAPGNRSAASGTWPRRRARGRRQVQPTTARRYRRP